MSWGGDWKKNWEINIHMDKNSKLTINKNNSKLKQINKKVLRWGGDNWNKIAVKNTVNWKTHWRHHRRIMWKFVHLFSFIYLMYSLPSYLNYTEWVNTINKMGHSINSAIRLGFHLGNTHSSSWETSGFSEVYASKFPPSYLRNKVVFNINLLFI